MWAALACLSLLMEFCGEQADVPAEQPAPGKDPRFPPTHADARRARDHVCAAAQGPQQAVGLTGTVLPGPARLRRRSEFQTAVRTGRRGSTRALTLHLATRDGAAKDRATATPSESFTESTRIGFVIPRAVGTAVVRNQVRRRLRHLLRDRLEQLPGDSLLVVRVAPPAARLSSPGLASALDEALRRLRQSRAEAGRDISRVLA